MRLALAAAALRRHRARTILATLGVAVAAAMLLDMTMLATGMRESFRSLLEERGFQLRLSPRGTLPFDTEATIAGAAELTATLRSLPGVAVVSPILGASIHVPRGARTVSAFALGIDHRVQGDYELVEGRDADAPDALVASDGFLRETGARLGDTLTVAVGYDPQLRVYAGARRLVVAGRARFLYLAREQRAAALPLATLQAMAGAERHDRVSLYMVRAAPGADVERLRATIEATLPRVTALSTAAAIAQTEERLSYFRQLAFILGAVSLAVGFLLVTTLVTVSVNERVGEIAVMRAIGVSKAHVVAQIVAEGVAVSLAGSVLGLALGLATARYLNSILSDFPGLPERVDFFLFQPSSALTALGLLFACGVVAGIYPSWRAASLGIAQTLRREAVV